MRETFCKHDTKNTEQNRWLLMRDSVTTLVVSEEANDLLSAVAGNQTNIECWIKTCECCQLGVDAPPVDVSTVPHPPLAVFHQVPTSIYH